MWIQPWRTICISIHLYLDIGHARFTCRRKIDSAHQDDSPQEPHGHRISALGQDLPTVGGHDNVTLIRCKKTLIPNNIDGHLPL